MYLALALALIWSRQTTLPRLNGLLRLRARLGWINYLIAAGILFVPLWIFGHSIWSGIFFSADLRLYFFILWVITLGFWLSRADELLGWEPLWAATLLVGGAASLTGYLLEVTNYPFALSWSEGNRMYDWSVMFGRARYIYPSDQPLKAFIDVGRQFLWGLPFLFPQADIVIVRFWDSFIFTVPYMLLGWLAFRHWREERLPWLLTGVWVYLLLSQGPIYTPLVVCAHPRCAGMALALTCRAGHGHTGEFPGPDQPLDVAVCSVDVGDHPGVYQRQNSRSPRLDARGGLRAGRHPGRLCAAVGIRAHKEVESFRFEPGLHGRQNVQPGFALVPPVPEPDFRSGHFVGAHFGGWAARRLAVDFVKRKVWTPNLWQAAAVIGALAAFLGVGLAVSVKIGGGSNLHNVDMFLIGMVFAVVAATQGTRLSSLIRDQLSGRLERIVILLMLALPAFAPFASLQTLGLPPSNEADEALAVIRTETAAAAEQGEVLFLDQRQLLTFGYVQDIALVSEYEKKVLMQNAIENDEAYFAPYYRDLSMGRFTLIVSEPLKLGLSDEESNFGEENDAWVYWVAKPTLCFYKPLMTFKSVGVELLVPRNNIEACAKYLK